MKKLIVNIFPAMMTYIRKESRFFLQKEIAFKIEGEQKWRG